MSTRTVYIQKNTKNRSFLAMYKILRDLGIKNNKFFLRLYDKALLDVDPFDEEHLSKEMKARIIREVKINPWYFFREIVRIPETGNLSGTMFKLHRGNLAELWCLLNNVNFILILPRQNFKTQSACAFYSYEYDFGTESTEFLFMNKEFDDSKLNVSRVNNIRRLYPSYLRISNKKLDRGNIEFIYNGTRGNRIVAVPTALDTDKADKLGRGMTAPNHWYDEFGFLKYNKIIHGAASPAYSEAAKGAKRNHTCYSKAITTTPSRLDIPQGRFCMDLIEDAASFIEQLYDMNETEVREYVDSNSRNDYVYIFFSYKQLGRSEAWFREQCRNLNNDMTLIKREILCEWAFSSENSPFSENELTEIENFKKDPVSSILFNKRFNIEVFEEMDAKRPYIASIDVSGGLSRDFSDISISDPYDLRTVAHFSSNKIDTPDLEEMIKFLNSLFPEMFYIIERNSYGLNVIQHLLKDPVLAKRVFYTEDVDKTVQSSAGGKPVPKRTYGINTNPQTRPKILEAFYILVTEEPYTLIAPKIIENTKTLEVKKNGKIEHAEGCCDDAVFSKAFAKYCMIHHYNTMKRFLHGADRVQNGSAPKEHRLNVSKFNRKGFMEKPDGAINTIISQGSQFIDETSASNSKLFKVAQLNHLRKQDVGLIYKDRNDGIDPEKYFEKYKNSDRRKRYVIS